MTVDPQNGHTTVIHRAWRGSVPAQDGQFTATSDIVRKVARIGPSTASPLRPAVTLVRPGAPVSPAPPALALLLVLAACAGHDSPAPTTVDSADPTRDSPADSASDSSRDTATDSGTDSAADSSVDTASASSEGLAGGWSIEHSATLDGALFIHPVTTDKDGGIVAARVASALGGLGIAATSDSRGALITPTRMSDGTYVDEVADFVVDDLYGALAQAGAPDQGLLGTNTLVLTSVHRFGLYVAEALHARLLPLQFMTFAADWSQVQSAATRSTLIVGQDSDYDGLWLWNKLAAGTPGTPQATLPPAYLRALAQADHVVIVQPDDNWAYCTDSYCSDVVNEVYTGAGPPVYLHTSLTRSHANNPGTALYAEAVGAGLVVKAMDADVANLKQWEWGVPDTTVANVRQAWVDLGKPPENLVVIAGGVVDMYGWTPWVWKAYLDHNGVAPRGIDVLSYWAAEPQLERAGAVLPIPSYSYYQAAWHPLDDDTRALLDDVCGGAPCNPSFAANSRAFVNGIGSSQDVGGVQAMMTDYGLDQANGAWYGYGINAEGTSPWTGWTGETVPYAWEETALSLQDPAQVPYLGMAWSPLTVDDVCGLGRFVCE